MSFTWPQIAAIALAQFRTVRNHLPRTNAGTILLWLLSALWYGMYTALAVLFAKLLPAVPIEELRRWLPVGLLGVFLFWQVIPLFTLSTGWSLQLNKLQIYPVSNSALFAIEVLLRLSAAPEMVLVLAGAVVGLERRADTPLLCALFIAIAIPLNLFLSLAIREFLLNSFERNRFRELFTILLISIGVLPQLLIRTPLGHKLKPFFFALADGRAAPWFEISKLATGAFSALDFAVLSAWTAACYVLARRQFQKSLVREETFRSGSPVSSIVQAEPRKPGIFEKLLAWPARLFSDPAAALLQKEFQSLLRMPRFRVMFGMACFFSVAIFLPVSLRGNGSGRFMSDNFLIIVIVYGLLLLSDALMLNVFGFDGAAAQIYFVTPVPFKTVLKAKNLAAIAFVGLQMVAVFTIAAVMRLGMSWLNLANAVAASAVVSIFFLSAGNLISISIPRKIDPKQTFRKQSGGKLQLWFLLCSIGMLVLMGFAFLARWAVQTNWAFFGVLLVEFFVGLIVYYVATESAVEKGMRERERLVETLSRGSAPIGLGL